LGGNFRNKKKKGGKRNPRRSKSTIFAGAGTIATTCWPPGTEHLLGEKRNSVRQGKRGGRRGGVKKKYQSLRKGRGERYAPAYQPFKRG